MAQFPKSLGDYINITALKAYTKTVEAEYFMLKELQKHLGIDAPGHKSSKSVSKAKIKRGPRGKVKETVLEFLHKNKKGKAIEIAELSGLKIASVQQTLFNLKKSGHVKQSKKRGSPFELVKK